MYTEQTEESWEERWAKALEGARLRPSMYIGDPTKAHRYFISSTYRLIWQAKVFRAPMRGRVDLSPSQYVARCDCGPLIRPVQEIFSFPGGRELGFSWREESRRYFERLHSEDMAAGLPFERESWRRGWRYCFAGPTGPRLSEPSYPLFLARRLAWGVRTDEGMWCQIYEAGWPLGGPFLITEPSPVGLIAMAELDPEWFTGLPYDEDVVSELNNASHKRVGIGIGFRFKPRPAWKTGQVEALWHPADTLLPSPITEDAIRSWLL